VHLKYVPVDSAYGLQQLCCYSHAASSTQDGFQHSRDSHRAMSRLAFSGASCAEADGAVFETKKPKVHRRVDIGVETGHLRLQPTKKD
jgi:hypothetical protein